MSERALQLAWLLRLRWGAVFAQLAVIAWVAWGLTLQLPLAELGAIVLVEAVTNLAAAIALRRAQEVREVHVAFVLLLDVMLFSSLLYYTGGPENPFSFLYLIYVALAAVVVRPGFAWLVVALAGACWAVLFRFHVALGTMPQGPHTLADHAAHLAHDHTRHVRGMWIAFAVAASFIAYFVQRIAASLRARELELAAARELATQQERLASLATLAAGAAHELATPLSTIAVTIKELEHDLAARGDDPALSEVRIVRAAVERCREILSLLSIDAGHPAGAALEPIAVRALVASARARFGTPRLQVTVPDALLVRQVVAPPRVVERALQGLVDNALTASEPDGAVHLDARAEGRCVVLTVSDEGAGMDPEAARRAVEPFYTTKPTGRGLGLGLFLAKTVAEQLGGELRLESRAGEGTRAALVLPLAQGLSA